MRKQLYQTALGNCYGLKLEKCLLQHCVTNYNFRYTCDLYTSCGEGGGGSLGGANIRSTRRGAEIGLKTEEGKLWQRGVVAQLWGVGLAIRRSRVRSPATARLRNTLGKSFTPNCLDADTVRQNTVFKLGTFTLFGSGTDICGLPLTLQCYVML